MLLGCACLMNDGLQQLCNVGDKRYLPVEALEDSIEQLDKVDMFALGMTLYECALSPIPLPNTYLHTSRIRNGDIDDIRNKVSPFFYELIRVRTKKKTTQTK